MGKKVISWVLSALMGGMVGANTVVPPSQEQVVEKSIVVERQIENEDEVETQEVERVTYESKPKEENETKVQEIIVQQVYVPIEDDEEDEEEIHEHEWIPYYELEDVAIDSEYVEHCTCRACGEDVTELMNPIWQFQEHAQLDKQLGLKNAGKYSSWGEWVPVYEEQEVLKYYECECGEHLSIEEYEEQ